MVSDAEEIKNIQAEMEALYRFTSSPPVEGELRMIRRISEDHFQIYDLKMLPERFAAHLCGIKAIKRLAALKS